MMKRFLIVIGFAIASVLTPTVAAQEICSCAPSSYGFRLDFNRTCEPQNVAVGKTLGIDRLFCRDSLPENPPAHVESYLILELDSELKVISQFYQGNLSLANGDTIAYTSIVDEENIPAALQMSLTGVNNNGLEVTNQWILTFTNRCSTPVFQEGDSMSWAVFDKLTPAQPELCNRSEAKATSASSASDDQSVKPVEIPDIIIEDAAMEAMSLSMSQSLRRLDWGGIFDTEIMKKDWTPDRINFGLKKRVRRRKMMQIRTVDLES